MTAIYATTCYLCCQRAGLLTPDELTAFLYIEGPCRRCDPERRTWRYVYVHPDGVIRPQYEGSLMWEREQHGLARTALLMDAGCDV